LQLDGGNRPEGKARSRIKITGSHGESNFETPPFFVFLVDIG
jgi:hypothetical protein